MIIGVDGQDVVSSSGLRNEIGLKRIGDQVKLGIIRGGEKRAVTVVIGPIGDRDRTSLSRP